MLIVVTSAGTALHFAVHQLHAYSTAVCIGSSDLASIVRNPDVAALIRKYDEFKEN